METILDKNKFYFNAPRDFCRLHVKVQNVKCYKLVNRNFKECLIIVIFMKVLKSLQY